MYVRRFVQWHVQEGHYKNTTRSCTPPHRYVSNLIYYCRVLTVHALTQNWLYLQAWLAAGPQQVWEEEETGTTELHGTGEGSPGPCGDWSSRCLRGGLCSVQVCAQIQYVV